MRRAGTTISPLAEVESGAVVGEGTAIWQFSKLRSGSSVGRDCNVGGAVYIGAGVQVGDSCKLENGAQLFEGAVVGTGVFVGPGSLLLNDLRPRAVTPAGRLKGAEDWTVDGVVVEDGASIGGGAIVLPGRRIGRYALVGAGAVVTRDVAPFALVVGNPARRVGTVCACGDAAVAGGACEGCGVTFREGAEGELEAIG